MRKTYCGIHIKSNYEMDAQEIAARLFLCPRISPSHVKRMLELLSSGKISIETIKKTTDEGMGELRSWIINGDNVPSIMSKRLEEWSLVFKRPNREDFIYIKAKLGFDEVELFGHKSNTHKIKVNSARELANYVKEYIKGQDEAIEQLSVPFFQHLDSRRNHYTCRIKTPVLLMGPTGIGKSEMLRVFARACDCPVIRINSSEVTPTNWRGLHINDVIARELSDKVTIKDLEYAIIVFHEFDKLTHHNQTIIGNTGTDADADMMRDIMRLFETEHSLHLEDGFDSQKMNSKYYKLPVDNLLVVFDGAFSGIEAIIKRRLNVGSTIGFTTSNKTSYDGANLQSLVTNEDLIEWGYMPELIGRIGNVVVLNPLSTETIYQIMVAAKESILKSHIDYCSRKNIELHFSKEALYYIADEAQKSGLGFRNVKTLLSKALNHLYYDLPASKGTHKKQIIEVSKEYVMNKIRTKQS